ncbi:MAG: hypothetical protein P1P88_11075 [Bacteroidales bacterium]|nr:hypothetical protein [Bacteroidales bacterium]
MRQPYINIELIAALIKELVPERTDIVVVQKLKSKKWIRQAYIPLKKLYDSDERDSNWQFEENILLEHETEGTIVLDVYKNGRIGGIELVNQIQD